MLIDFSQFPLWLIQNVNTHAGECLRRNDENEQKSILECCWRLYKQKLEFLIQRSVLINSYPCESIKLSRSPPKGESLLEEVPMKGILDASEMCKISNWDSAANKFFRNNKFTECFNVNRILKWMSFFLECTVCITLGFHVNYLRRRCC